MAESVGVPVVVEDVRRVVETALAISLKTLARKTLPSTWSKSGLGWQEVWESAKHAGAYASCDGILLLDEMPSIRNGDSLRALVHAVYNQHLCLVMDENVKPAKENIRSRRACTTTTMYIAKFLQASINRHCVGNSHLLRHFRQKLILAAGRLNGLWACTIAASETRPVLCATAESLIALSRLGESSEFIDPGLRYLRKVARSRSEPGRRRVALWGLSELMRHADERIVKGAGESIAEDWDTYESDSVEFDTTKYFNSLTNETDYYTYDVRLLFAKATLALVRGNVLNEEYLTRVLPIIQHVSESIRLNDGMFKPAENAQVQFWQHYQALDLLIAFVNLVRERKSLKEEAYVLVNPVHFHKKGFKPNPRLGVVLMPFPKKGSKRTSLEWPDAVLKVFTRALAENGFQCWRADMETGDDNIIQTIWKQINRARFVIADCTGQNPNVFYELGIADTIGKPVFRCAQDRKDFPFDIAGIRSHVYGTLPEQLQGLRRRLVSFIKAL